MKKYLLPLLLIITTVSCKNVWNEAGDNTFHKACVDDAKTWIGSPEKAEIYCNCVIEKVKAKYPDEDEAMKKIDDLSTDKDLRACRDSINNLRN